MGSDSLSRQVRVSPQSQRQPGQNRGICARSGHVLFPAPAEASIADSANMAISTAASKNNVRRMTEPSVQSTAKLSPTNHFVLAVSPLLHLFNRTCRPMMHSVFHGERVCEALRKEKEPSRRRAWHLDSIGTEYQTVLLLGKGLSLLFICEAL